MSRPDEGLIHQWLDGECTPEESARLEQLVATDPEWAAAVAEARGLIAASSRIVQSLDAVPRAMPAGSVAAPRVAALREDAARAPQRFATKPWMRIAAAVVLVAGTAYVLREQAVEPFVPVASVENQERGATPEKPPTANADRVAAPVEPTAAEPAAPGRAAGRADGFAQGGGAAKTTGLLPSTPLPAAPVASSPVVNEPPPPPPSAPSIARAEEESRSRVAEDMRNRTANIEMQRRARLTAEAPRGATLRIADAPSAAPAMTPALLDGCWRVSAPPELEGVLNAPQIRRQRGDTLVLVTTVGDVVVVRSGDSLQGGLVARAEPCTE